MELLRLLYQVLRHVGEVSHWAALINYVGHPTLYLLMFAVIFAETGLVVLPFLPGDSLLFAIGALGTQPEIGINLWLMTGLLIVAAVIGDAVNYSIGHLIGPKLFSAPDAGTTGRRTLRSRLLNRHHLEKAQAFYDKYGGKTIILARFVPIVRTFAPFVAGMGKMSYPRFFLYNVVGAILWVGICISAGVVFGRFEIVKKNFELVILLIVAISVVPMLIEFWKAKRKRPGEFDIVEATTVGEKVD